LTRQIDAGSFFDAFCRNARAAIIAASGRGAVHLSTSVPGDPQNSASASRINNNPMAFDSGSRVAVSYEMRKALPNSRWINNWSRASSKAMRFPLGGCISYPSDKESAPENMLAPAGGDDGMNVSTI
jgi:hypothetical protein